MLFDVMAKLGGRNVQVVVLALAVVFVSLPSFFVSMRIAGELEPSWSSAATWVRSAECARTTKAILVICHGGRLLPIADESAGDDPGPPAAMGAYAALTGAVVTESDVSRINTIINYAGILSLAALLFCARLPFLSFLTLTIGAMMANHFHSLGPHPAQFGVACLATLLPLAILALPPAGAPRSVFWLWIACGILGLAIAMMFREAIGLMGVLAGLLALGISYFGRVLKSSAIAHVLIACLAVATIWVPYSALRARDAAFHVAPSTRMEQHGTWHNLYIGLGAVENPFGIAWNDDSAIEGARRINPAVVYLSNEYFSILRHRYLEIVLQHPLEVAVVYLKKLGEALKAYGMWLIIPVVVVVFARGRILLLRQSRHWCSLDGVFFVGALFVAMFLGQATLFNFGALYLFPVKLFLLLLSGLLVELLFAVRSTTASA